MTLEPIPQSDPRASYLAHKQEIDEAIARVLDRGSYILGEEVSAFEREFASYIGAAHGIGVASGTDALMLALRACDLGADAEVITVSHTAVASIAAIELAGAIPVLVDIDPQTYTLDVSQIEQVLTPRTRAIIPVHLYGHPAAMDAILEMAKRYHLRVIEDCAQSHGAQYQRRKVGSFGDLAAFSFYPTKNLGAIGDGGMILCNDPALADRLRALRQYGWQSARISTLPGANSRLDELQAAILRVKLRHLDQDNLQRHQLAQLYTKLLEQSCYATPTELTDARHTYHQYVVRVSDRAPLQAFLTQQAITTAVHYPVPIHLQPAYRNRLRTAVSMQHTERAAQQILSLPMYPQLTDSQIERVAHYLRFWCESNSSSPVT
ncbi:MAG: DegT/DnrJ/EryC1/StrS family aminotransferase [Anaerolineae bacterium]|nr:DegT/DnrJ/EryC1/StrS family aminotransferase [Anaerolineae bacterium]